MLQNDRVSVVQEMKWHGFSSMIIPDLLPDQIHYIRASTRHRIITITSLQYNAIYSEFSTQLKKGILLFSLDDDDISRRANN